MLLIITFIILYLGGSYGNKVFCLFGLGLFLFNLCLNIGDVLK